MNHHLFNNILNIYSVKASHWLGRAYKVFPLFACILSMSIAGISAGSWETVWAADNSENPLFVVNITSSINPAVADHLQSSIKKAIAANAVAIVIELDTPGGLAESMHQMVKSILAAPIPTIVYVSPSGARAASAGVMITMAADIAAMAPGTNIGAAHPVGIGGKQIDDQMSAKVVNDMVAHARSVAEQKGRNADWVEKAIRESVSITEQEALKKGVIDVVAIDLNDLIDQLEGRSVKGKGEIALAEAPVVRVRENIRTKVLKAIGNPNIAYILMMIGLAGIYFELSHPGAIFPGVIGGISLILAFFALQTLPVNYAGILLIILALVLFIMELKITSYGLLSIAGIISMSLGSLMLFEGGAPGFDLSWKVVFPTVAMVSGFFIAVATLVVRAQVMQPRTGEGGMVGMIGTAKTVIDLEGKVLVHGELWQAKARSPIAQGDKVRVVDIEGLVLEVEPHQ
jgi:membrane-bound serine protease (ClpP class)